MINIMHREEDIDKYLADKEYIANTYVIRCFNISMLVYCVGFLLNVMDIFIVDKNIMINGFVPSVFIYLIMILVTKKFSLSSTKMKYFILFCIVSVFTLIGVTITYHVVIISVLPILYAVLYSSKKVVWYVYGLTVISTIIIVYAGYYYGLCDANMTLLTSTKLDNYLVDGYFKLTKVNDNVVFNLMLFFVIPRCLIYIAFMGVCRNIYKIISAGLEKAEYVTKMELFQRVLKNKVEEQTLELREQQRKINEGYWQTIAALSEAVEAKDRYTSGHSKRVAEYSRMIAERMGKSEKEQEIIYRAGLLHDVGKIKVPVDIINKSGKLTDEEYDLIKIHPVTGYYILKDISEHSDMDIAAKYHHERYDGKGYPNGLSGENIPELARILAVADSYDAMTSNRSYRKGLPQSVVRSEIEKGKGTQFDSEIADIMLQIIDEDKEYRLRQIDKNNYRILMISEDKECNQQVKAIMQDESIYKVNILNTVTAEAVFNELKEQTFELIIMDIQSNLNECWKILQIIKEKYQIPVILISDDKNLRNSKEFREFGCDDYFSKPLSDLMFDEILYNMTKKCR
ncbi:MAG: HD domain-containing protein [Lachnospiraceae bacterium]|nr:HD domain-containing protein [Lachnospiraceae bacterium]